MSENENKSMKTKVFANLFWKFAERITAQIVTLVVSIVLARLLMPEDYGAVALIMVFITIANVFVSNGLGNALIQKIDADKVDFSSVFIVNLLISFLIYGILFFTAPYIARFYGMEILCPALRVLAIRIPVAAVNSVQHAYVSREMLFRRFFWSTLFGTVVSGVAGVILAYHGFGIWALVAQYLINTCVDTVVLFFTVDWRPQLLFSWSKTKKLIYYGWKLLASALLDTGYAQLRNLLIGKLYSSSDLAYYNQGDKYPALIVNNINASISSVLFPALSQYQNDKEKVKMMTRRAIQVSSYIMWPLMVGLGVIAEPLVSLILTDKWLPCVPYLRIFCFTYGLWPVHTANIQAINALGRSDLFLRIEVIKKCIGMIALLVSLPFGPIAVAASLIVTGITSTFINSAPNRKLLKYGFREQFEDMLPPLILSAVMGAIVYPIGLLHMSEMIALAIQIIAGIIVYALGSILTKQKGYLFCVDVIKKRK